MPWFVPKGWFDYVPLGSPIPGTRIIATKTPLQAKFNTHLTRKQMAEQGRTHGVPMEDEFTPSQLMDKIASLGHTLGLVIDLTNTDRYYNQLELVKKGVKYYKLQCVGQELPSVHVYTKFSETLKSFLESNPDPLALIAVHCTHGVNRTGYLICRYLMEFCDFECENAICAFGQARGHDIERENYIEHLRQGCPLPSLKEQSHSSTSHTHAHSHSDPQSHPHPPFHTRPHFPAGASVAAKPPLYSGSHPHGPGGTAYSGKRPSYSGKHPPPQRRHQHHSMPERDAHYQQGASHNGGDKHPSRKHSQHHSMPERDAHYQQGASHNGGDKHPSRKHSQHYSMPERDAHYQQGASHDGGERPSQRHFQPHSMPEGDTHYWQGADYVGGEHPSWRHYQHHSTPEGDYHQQQGAGHSGRYHPPKTYQGWNERQGNGSGRPGPHQASSGRGYGRSGRGSGRDGKGSGRGGRGHRETPAYHQDY